MRDQWVMLQLGRRSLGTGLVRFGARHQRVVTKRSLRRRGDSMVARCYWDFGRWSDLWRLWRPLPTAHPGFVDCLASTRTQMVRAGVRRSIGSAVVLQVVQ